MRSADIKVMLADHESVRPDHLLCMRPDAPKNLRKMFTDWVRMKEGLEAQLLLAEMEEENRWTQVAINRGDLKVVHSWHGDAIPRDRRRKGAQDWVKRRTCPEEGADNGSISIFLIFARPSRPIWPAAVGLPSAPSRLHEDQRCASNRTLQIQIRTPPCPHPWPISATPVTGSWSALRPTCAVHGSHRELTSLPSDRQRSPSSSRKRCRVTNRLMNLNQTHP